MLKKFMDIIIGQPIENEASGREKFNVPMGLAIMSSDAISSVAYAAEAILTILIPAIGMMSYKWLTMVSMAIIVLLILLAISYTQIIDAYPQGGGAYVVAKENICIKAGLLAGAALAVDYVLTVAVSGCAGISAITSAFPSLYNHRVALAVVLILILTILNLRGIGDSGKIFSIPTYIFIISMIFMIVYGMIKYFFILHGHVPAPLVHRQIQQMEPVGIFLILKAFSSGCSALTGIEAVSNAVPNFREPSQRNAKIVLICLAMLIMVVFGGTSVLAHLYSAIPDGGKHTVISQIAYGVFNHGFMFYIIQLSTALILMMACNTAFTGFPTLMYVVGKDGYAPRQFTIRGQRLSFSTGIIVLSTIACLLVVIFKASEISLLPLYSVGVFLSFTLAQTGMVIHWKRTKEKFWQVRAAINGFGAFITVCATIIIAVVKFPEGAWIVVIIIPILVKGMLEIKGHYDYVARNLRAEKEDMAVVNDYSQFTHHIIIPIASLTKATISALQYARSITPNVIALNISTNKESIEKLQSRWKELDTDIMLICKYSKYRAVMTPLLNYIANISRAAGKNEKVTVILPEFITKKWWGKILHNHTSFFLRQAVLSNNEDVTVATYAYHFKEEEMDEEDPLINMFKLSSHKKN